MCTFVGGFVSVESTMMFVGDTPLFSLPWWRSLVQSKPDTYIQSIVHKHVFLLCLVCRAGLCRLMWSLGSHFCPLC